MAGGVVRIRWCSALMQPGSAEVLDAVKRHPRLKGYLGGRSPSPAICLLKARGQPRELNRLALSGAWLPDHHVVASVAPIGLSTTRLSYCRSVARS